MSNRQPSRFRRLMKKGWVKSGEYLKSYGWLLRTHAVEADA
jgi:hypothetical protein